MLESSGVRKFINIVKSILIPLSKRRTKNFKRIKSYFLNKTGLEIGGPSDVFGLSKRKGFIPLYQIAHQIDGCNFSNNTVWENTIKEGANYRYNDKLLGYQYIKEAQELSGIESNYYDFVIASHCLEHVANPLKAVAEWIRVLKPGGALMIIVPDKRFVFDHKRSYTTFEHLLSDYKNGTTEHDLTHLPEILELHDLDHDKAAGGIEKFKQRSLDNYNNRCLHHHVFDVKLLEQIFNYFNLKLVFTEVALEIHIIAMGIKTVKN